jgi:hypothetical protein
MNIPSMVSSTLLDSEGKMSETWMNDFNQLLTQLQQNLSDEGYRVPGQKSADVQKLSAPQSSNALLVDSDTQELIVNLGGTWVKLLTAPYP